MADKQTSRENKCSAHSCAQYLYLIKHVFLINSEAYGVFEGNLIETLCKPLEGLSKNIICSDFPKLFLTFSFIGGMPKITEKDVKMLRFLVHIEATSLC